jgi:hypothetical protein
VKPLNKKQLGLTALLFSLLGLFSILLSVLPGMSVLQGAGGMLMLASLPLYGRSSTYEYY